MDGRSARTRKNTVVVIILACAVVLAAFACLLVGSSRMSAAECLSALLGRIDGTAARIIWNIRIPRLLAHFPAAALAELAQQQDQAHRPGHGKHHRDEYPRTQVVIVLFRRLRLKTVVLIVFVAHASPSPFPRSFRLLPFSSTI